MKFASLLITILICSRAMADGTMDSNALVKRFEDSAKAAESAAKSQFPLEQAGGSILEKDLLSPSPTPTKDLRSTDRVIDDLMRQVESFRTKAIMAKKVALAEERPRETKIMGAKTIYTFKENEIYQVHAGVDRVTDIELQPGEILSSPPVSGDTIRWKITLTKSTESGKEITHVIIKPLDIDIETNLILTTNKRTYHLRLMAGDWYMPAIAWNYPQDEEIAEQLKTLEAQKNEAVSLSPEELNFGYEISGDDYDWKPLRIFDDGAKSYLQMSPRMRTHEAPALFIIEDNDVQLVNYRVKGDFYIVDRLFDHAQLRVGTKRIVDIYSDKASPTFFERIF